MAKLTRYDSFQSLKADANQIAVNAQQSEALHEEMEHFVELLRDNLVDKKASSEEALKPAHLNGQ